MTLFQILSLAGLTALGVAIAVLPKGPWRGARVFLLLMVAAAICGIAKPIVLQRFAEQLGIGRGADLVTYFNAAALFLCLMRMLARETAFERQIASLTRQMALRDARPGLGDAAEDPRGECSTPQDKRPLAGEGDQDIVPALRAAGTGKPIR